ncbi:helix-turn-helix domain-containing protein [Chryseobacterium sp. SIMBA_029]|uniref:helix-turn-helix domain-containing protein n=1 Tax=Chryseobacterium sp. SIMBA_029 TaxID=3085772 RepID=UPI00397DAD16
MATITPDYKKIYHDIILKKYPEKYNLCSSLLEKKTLSQLDIIKLNQLVFTHEDKKTFEFNQKHRAYDEPTIFEILTYQQKERYSNTRIAKEFNISRNTIAKWKKIFNHQEKFSMIL